MNQLIKPRSAAPLFDGGQIVATPNALSKVCPEAIKIGLDFHFRGGWGLVTEDTAEQNNLSVAGDAQAMILSIFEANDSIRFWIITEWDRSVTTVLMPEDY